MIAMDVVGGPFILCVVDEEDDLFALRERRF
jgi:hypothetical protein